LSSQWALSFWLSHQYHMLSIRITLSLYIYNIHEHRPPYSLVPWKWRHNMTSKRRQHYLHPRSGKTKNRVDINLCCLLDVCFNLVFSLLPLFWNRNF
jgi:hypothetical protein